MDWIKNNIRRLHEVLHKRGWKRQDAEDVIQDAFLRMQTYCNEGGKVRNAEAFLVRTVLNMSANSRGRRHLHQSVEDLVEAPSHLLGIAPAPEEELAAEEYMDRISAAVDAMTPRTQQIFVLHYVDDYTYKQISQQLGISVSAIEKHIARAMLAMTQERT